MNEVGFDKALSPDLAEQIEQQCDLFEDALQSGRCLPLATALEALPTAARHAAFRALLQVEIGYLADIGRPANPADYLVSYPTYGDVIASVFGLLPAALTESAPPQQADGAAKARPEMAVHNVQQADKTGAAGRHRWQRLLLWTALLLALGAVIVGLLTGWLVD